MEVIINKLLILGVSALVVSCLSNVTEPEEEALSTSHSSESLMNTSSSTLLSSSSISVIHQTEFDTIIDSRDAKVYKTIQIDNQLWMAENLNYGTMVSSVDTAFLQSQSDKFCYNDNPENCELYGGLYQWHNVIGIFDNSESPISIALPNICPKGWTVPTHQDWVTLINKFGGYDNSGYSLKSNNSGFDSWDVSNYTDGNSSGFSILPTGKRLNYGHFEYRGFLSAFWEFTLEGETFGYTWITLSNSKGIKRSQTLKGDSHPIRCIKE